MKDFEEIVLGRKSIRLFDENCKIDHKEMLTMLNETVLAPSSMNDQPWRFIVVDSPEKKKELDGLLGPNHDQVTTAAAIILVLGDLEAGKMKISPKKRQKTNLDVGLAVMQLMLVARSHGYDTCAIGAFEEEELGQAFQLDLKRYTIVTTLAIGKAAAAGQPQDRQPAEELTTFK